MLFVSAASQNNVGTVIEIHSKILEREITDTDLILYNQIINKIRRYTSQR